MLSFFLIVFGFFWLFNFSHVPISNTQFIKMSGQEGLLDTMFFYSSQEGGLINPKVPGGFWPYRADSYILISAGPDGLYGTGDDITNF